MYNESLEADETEMAGGGLRSRLGRWFDNHLSGRGEEEESYDDNVATATAPPASSARSASSAGSAPQRRDSFRLSGGREGSITIMPVTSFADVQKAADRLKSGEPQIVNLEKTPPEVAERLIDFLNGVTYALDGYVEKVSEGAYLFTPSFIPIHSDGPDSYGPSRTIFDRM